MPFSCLRNDCKIVVSEQPALFHDKIYNCLSNLKSVMPFAGEKEEECVEERQLCLYRKHKSCLLINFYLAGLVTWLLRLLKQLIFTQSWLVPTKNHGRCPAFCARWGRHFRINVNIHNKVSNITLKFPKNVADSRKTTREALHPHPINLINI